MGDGLADRYLEGFNATTENYKEMEMETASEYATLFLPRCHTRGPMSLSRRLPDMTHWQMGVQRFGGYCNIFYN